MQALTFSATFDGEHIRLEEPHKLPKNARLLVTVLPPDDELAKERADWLQFAAQNLARAYGPDEPEYTLDMVRERNPDYEERRCGAGQAVAGGRRHETASDRFALPTGTVRRLVGVRREFPAPPPRPGV